MTVAHPNHGLPREILQNGLVNFDRLGIIAQVRQHRGLEIQVSRIARLTSEQSLNLLQCRRGLPLPVEYHGVVMASRIEAGAEFEAALEQRLRVRVPT